MRGESDTAHVSRYVRLASVFRDRIATGEWLPGAQLPTIPALAARYDVGIVTVRQALMLLAKDRLIVSHRGKGTFVCEPPAPTHDSRALRQAITNPLATQPDETMRCLVCKSVKELPSELSRAPEAAHRAPQYVRIRKLHSLKGAPFNISDIYVTREIFDRFPRGSEKRSRIGRLVRDFGNVRVVHYRQEMTIAYADAEDANLLACAVGTVLVRIRRWRTDDRGKLIYTGINLYRGDTFVLDLVDDSPTGDDFRVGLVPKSTR
jgi:GntR family transcriptional regulator